jgi:hypothetical protein
LISGDKYRPVLFDKTSKKLRRGSIDHSNYWNEQIRRCREGWKPNGGTFMPGPYYFYLNFSKIHAFDEKIGRKRMMAPSYRDQDHEYFTEIHNAKEGGYGIIVGKARRKGFSFMNANILLAEWSLYPDSENGIGAQMEHYVQDFRKKMMMSYYALPTEMRSQTLHNNELILQSGYKEKEEGQWVEKGMKSMIHFRVMDKPDAFRGTTMTYWVLEEAGEFKKLKKAYYANEECFREGSLQFGVPIIGGTSNQISNESEDFMEMYYNPEEYNLKKIFISAAKVYHGFFHYKTGVSDIEGATKHIEHRAAEKKKARDKALYYAFRQEMPLKEEHMFLQVGTTPFDLDKINIQTTNILTNKKLKIVRKANLNWQKNSKGKYILGSKIDVEYSSDGKFEILHENLENFKNVHVSAVDPYHVDDSLENSISDKESDGCMCVYRRFVNMDIPGELPVAMYTDRPYSKEEFYENCLKLAVYYQCQILVEYNDDGFLKYFIKHNMTRYLKERPRSADSPYSQVSNKYGIHMKSYQKSLLVELVDEYIKKHYEDIYFMRLLEEMAVFGKKNTDRVMAFGLALIHDMDTTRHIVNKENEDDEVKDFYPHFKRKSDGTIVSVHNKNNNNFQKRSKNPTFDYNFD